MGDYMFARQKFLEGPHSKKIDMLDLFLKHHTVHVFRSVEPALFHKYQEVTCSPQLEMNEYQRCVTRQRQGLASQAQLAMLIFKHQQKLDEGQMDVIHKENVESQ